MVELSYELGSFLRIGQSLVSIQLPSTVPLEGERLQQLWGRGGVARGKSTICLVIIHRENICTVGLLMVRQVHVFNTYVLIRYLWTLWFVRLLFFGVAYVLFTPDLVMCAIHVHFLIRWP